VIGAAGRALTALAALAAIASLAACAGSSGSEATAAASAPTAGGGGVSGRYKVGKPYQIKGIWYYPRVDYGYDEVGIASWYGPGFHGEQTANGEVYDMNDMTAAHKTLPMPSIVRVTNLENGRTIKLRINDRGPFVGERIIDVSRRGAQLLGFYGAGTARVRVQIEAEESQELAAALTGVPVASIGAAAMPSTVYAPPAAPAAEPTPVVAAAVLPPVDPSPQMGWAEPPPVMSGSGANDDLPPDPRLAAAAQPVDEVLAEPLPPAALPAAVRGSTPAPRTAAASPLHFVQAGAFADPANIAKARAKLDPLGPVEVKPLSVDGRPLMRVRVGPLDSEAEAQKVLLAAVRAGFVGSRVVLE
jgi:rare lipoprotein A